MDPVSAIGLADNCVSFATALYGYITVVASVKDEILSVSTELQATGAVLRDLDQLIKENKDSSAWKAEGMSYAQGVIDKTEDNVRKMRKLLLKTSASTKSSRIEREDIDVSKLNRLVFWPYRKSKLDPRRAELAASKIDILLAYTMYLAAAKPNSEDGKRAKAGLPELYRAKRVAMEDIRNLKAYRNSPYDPNGRLDSNWVGGPVDQPGGPPLLDHDLEAGAWVYSSEDAIRRDFEDWAKEKEEKQKKAEEQRKEIELRAVEEWKQVEREKVQQQLKAVEEQRLQLEGELRRQQMPPQQIRITLDHLHPLPQLENNLALAALSTVEHEPTQEYSNATVLRQSKSRFWSKFKGNRAVKREEVPSVLQDPAGPGGLAAITVILLERCAYPSGTKIIQTQVKTETQWLIDAVRKSNTRSKDSGINPAWDELARLPQDFRAAISSRLNFSDSTLILIRSMKSSKLPSVFSKSRDRVHLVYVVIKRAADATATSQPDAAKERNDRRGRRSDTDSDDSSDSDKDCPSERSWRHRRTRRSRSPNEKIQFDENITIAKRASRVPYERPEPVDSYEDEVLKAWSGVTRDAVLPERRRTEGLSLGREPVSRSRSRPPPSFVMLPNGTLLARGKEKYFSENLNVRSDSLLEPSQFLPYEGRRRRDTFETSNPTFLKEERSGSPTRVKFYDRQIPGDGYKAPGRRNTYQRYMSGDDYGSLPHRSSYYPRQMSGDDYGFSKHARFADQFPEKVLNSRIRPRRQPTGESDVLEVEVIEEMTDDLSSSSSDDDDDDDNSRAPDVRKGRAAEERSDVEITRHLMARFETDGTNAMFGDTISEEPESTVHDAATDGADRATPEDEDAYGSRRSRRVTVESVNRAEDH